MRRSTFFWGGLLVLLGVLELLSAMDIPLFGVDPGRLFWPLFFLLLGSWIVIEALVAPRAATESVRVERKDIASALVRAKHGAGALNLGAGAEAGQLVTGEFSGGVVQTIDYSGDKATVTLRSLPGIHFSGPMSSNDWNVHLADGLPLELELSTGASESRIDLSALQVTRLDLSTGASSTTLTLPASGRCTAKVNAGAASLVVRIPAGMAARIKVRTGVGVVDIDSKRFPYTDGYHQSPDYETASDRVDLKINSGVGSVTVE